MGGVRFYSNLNRYGIIQPSQNTLEEYGLEYEWSKYYPSEIAEIMTATYGNTEVRTILTRIIGKEIDLTRRGFRTRPPLDGCINKRIVRDGKKRTIQVPDPERAKYFIEMFNLRACGRYTDQEIVDKINATGFRTRER